IQKASDRLEDVLKEIPRVRAEVGFPPLVTPMSQIVGTQSVFNVLTGKRWSVVSKEMKDYLLGYYGKAPGPVDQDIFKKAVGKDEKLPDDVAPSSLISTTYEDVKAEIGDLAKSEEDVLMYALFPQSARTYLSKHPTPEKTEFLIENESKASKEDDYVDINQIRELIRAVEESNIGEITIKDAGSEITVRKSDVAVAAASVNQSNAAQANATSAPKAEEPKEAPKAEESANVSRPSTWVAVTSPIVGTYYQAPAPGAEPFVKVGDKLTAGDTLCIVEAMKLMNEITAEQMCIVREVVLEDATPVEYADVLFYVEPITE
ncbi:MAG: acetyl-CoA carboxylase biotin carboxyl carrier protein, partial [Coriobacteriia bacterium]|nr:acetyl-CoA carboxylase biotin carboxyl carrier protein [Coriobacteriia bacterium]